MVYAFAARLRTGDSWLDYGDIVGEGFVGLAQAAQTFDESKGVNFSTFAAARIRGAMLDALRSSMPLSRSVAQNLRKYNQTADELASDLGRYATDEEIAARLDTDLSSVKATKSWTSFRLLSLNDSRPDTQEMDVADDADVESEFTRAYSRDALRSYITRLMPRDRAIIQALFFEFQTQRTIADRYQISESRVSQIRRRALNSLRTMIERDDELAAA
jgi:RNA polymerase sigma factor for flagellar operon FliA